jgi:hypothetical protein
MTFETLARPAGRPRVARDFNPWMPKALTLAFFRPAGRTTPGFAQATSNQPEA